MTAPRAAFVLALGLALGRASQGTDEESEDSGYSTPEETTDEEAFTTSMLSVVTTEALATEALATGALATGANSTSTTDENSSQLEFLLMVVIPVAVLVLLILIGILIATYFKRKRTKQEPSSQGSQSALQTCELGGENLKVPIFEEDTPSVMEIEMEELDKWMNSMNRNADYECLPTLKEEKEPNPSPSDNES